tara:strand:+ start:11 stop:460 length:450 start_codon:yes stop_codon:yes gene_type:complete
MKIAIVLSEFNDEISNNLLEGARTSFNNILNEKDNSLELYRVPGAFEIPSAVKQLLKNKNNLDAIVTLGCVIKGETAHFEYISSSVTDSISQISIDSDTNIPIIYGILTTYDYDQALERSNPLKKDKGGQVMEAAINTIKTFKDIQKTS